MGLLNDYYGKTKKPNPFNTQSAGAKSGAQTGGGFLTQYQQKNKLQTPFQVAPVKPVAKTPVKVAQAPQIKQPQQKPQQQTGFQKHATLLKDAPQHVGNIIKGVKSIDYERVRKFFDAGKKSVPGMLKGAGGIMAESWTKEQKFVDDYFRGTDKKLLGMTNPILGSVMIANEIIKPAKEKAYPVINKQAGKLKEQGLKDQQKAAEPLLKLGAPKSKEQGLAESIAFNLPQMATSLGLTIGTAIVSKNPKLAGAVGLSTSYGLGANEVYRTARQNGLSDREAQPIAMLGGFVIGAIDAIPLNRFISKTGAIDPVKRSIVQKISRGLASAGAGSTFESVTEMVQEIVGNAIQSTYKENVDLFENVTEAGLVAWFTGGMADATVGGITALGGKSKKPDEIREEINNRIETAMNKAPENRTPEEREIVQAVLTKQVTPDEAANIVIDQKLGKTEEGKQIMQQVLAAKENDQDLLIRANEDGTIASVETVDPNTIPEAEELEEVGSEFPESKELEISLFTPEEVERNNTLSEVRVGKKDDRYHLVYKDEGLYRHSKYPNGFASFDEAFEQAQVHNDSRVKLNKTPKGTTKKLTFTGNTEEDARMLIAASEKSHETFKASVDTIAKRLGIEVSHGPLKKFERVFEKARNDYNGDVSRVMDVNRTTLHISDPNGYTDVVKTISETFEIVREKNNLLSDQVGYKSAIVNVRLEDGTVAEIQMATPEYLHTKHELGGHKLYQQVRVKEGDWEKAEAEMNRLYAEAEKALLSRLNSSSETSRPSDNALKGGNGAPEAVVPNTSPDSLSTTTGTSSTSKNRGNVDSVIEPPFRESIPQTQPQSKRVLNTKEVTALKEIIDDRFKELRGLSSSGTEFVTRLQKLYTDVTRQANGDKVVLSALRTQLNKEMDGLVGATGDYKQDFKLRKELIKTGGELGEMVGEIESLVQQLDEKLLSAQEPQRVKPTPEKAEGGGERVTTSKETPVGTGRMKNSRLFERVKDTLGSEYENENRKYNTLDLEKQARFVTDLLESDPEKAVRIARGKEEPPQGMTQNAVAVGLAEVARSKGDFVTAAMLWTQTSLRSTRLGQEIVSLRGNFSGNEALNAVKAILGTRMEDVSKRYSDVIKGLSVPDTAPAVKKVDALVTHQAKRAKKEIAKRRAALQSAQEILNELMCKV